MNPLLVVNRTTREMFLVKNLDSFSKDYGAEFTKKPYTEKEVFDIRAIGKFPAAHSWKTYTLSDRSLDFTKSMCPRGTHYILIGRVWFEESVFQQFQELQQKLGRVPEKPIESRVDGVKENSLALIIELVELLQELPHKSWRSTSKQPHNEANALEELIDVFFFVFNIAIAMRWTYADLIVTMAYKMKKNFNRVDEGYNQVD